MLEQIVDLVKEYGQDTVVFNSAIPNSQNNEVLAEATFNYRRSAKHACWWRTAGYTFSLYRRWWW